MKKQNPIKIYSVIILSFFLLLPLSLHSVNNDQVTTRLETIQKLIAPELTWTISIDKEGPPGKFELDDRIKHKDFVIQTVYKGPANFCGINVLDTPMHLELLFYSKGFSEIEVWVGDNRADTFQVDGSSGTGAELEKTIVVTSNYALQEYSVKFKVKNKGFKPFRTDYWPPRKKEPIEENSYFMIKEARIAFPAAAEPHQKMKAWLLSMQNGYALLNPDFQRFTFIGQPFKIEDKRNTPKMRLKIMGRKLKRAIMTMDPILLSDNQPEKLAQAIKESYILTRPLKRFAKNFEVYLIGNAHIDIAWLWRMSETVMVARNTYDTVLKNMEEYPELHYAQSQAITYQWMEKQYPDIFERIKQKVKEGKWEIVGGMWVEPDCNLISGESWVRQLLYGKRYFKEKFGLDVDTGWNPDSFGYNWNMPQIYTKSGIKRFITQKIWWNDTTVFPHFIFWWKGVDDTRLLTYFPPVGYTARVKLPKDIVNITRYEATTGYKKTLLLYGLGDHGGGPNREILNRVRSYKDLHIAPKFIHSKSIDFLQNMTTDLKDEIPVWEDELYLEYHRGTYTTQAETKKNNRKSESYLSSAEKLAAAASMIDPASVYPKTELEQAWKIVLTNQFHDILPGSSITPVYHDAREDYKRAHKKIKKVIGTSLEKIAKNIDTSKVHGKPLVVFNPLSWTRWDVVSLNVPLAEDQTVSILDADGKEVPVEINRHCESQEASLCFIAKDIPALGYRVYSIVSKKTEPGTEDKMKSSTDETGDFLHMENKFYKLKINKKSGNIAGLFDKQLNKEFIAQGKEANVLQVYEDLPEHWDAWNIGYTGRMFELNQAESVEIVEDSPVRQVVKVTKNFLGLSKNRYSPTEEFPSSFFTQYLILYKGLDRIDIKTQADWWEDHMMLKAAFPVNIKSDFATYEIPYASIKRTTKSETLWEKARFEVPALRWADLSDETGGISLLNDSKYGHDIHGDVMKISLLRAPTWPDPMADRGTHSFVYSIYTHKGAVAQSATVKRGRELNAPFLTLVTDNHEGTLPLSFGFFEVRSGSVILDTVKKAEDDDRIILRLYESSGTDGSAEIVFFKQPKTILETDLMETPGQEHQANEKSLSLTFKKFEIKTLKVQF